MGQKGGKMRIKLRPYHPTYVIGCFGVDVKTEGFNKDGFNEVIGKIRGNPDIEVELVEGYDDICMKCDRLVEDKKGSIWGKRYSCPSAKDASVVDKVNAANKRVLRGLGLQFGSVVKLKELVKLLSERIPILDDDTIGGPKFQEKYEKGLVELSSLYHRRDKDFRM